jgi:hypothetical protein
MMCSATLGCARNISCMLSGLIETLCKDHGHADMQPEQVQHCATGESVVVPGERIQSLP